MEETYLIRARLVASVGACGASDALTRLASDMG